jgi:hypothetical protein
MNRIAIIATAFSLVTAAWAGILLEKPEGAVDVKDTNGRFQAWGVGIETNVLRIIPPGVGAQDTSSCSPLKMTRQYTPRDVKTVKEWEDLRQDIRKRILEYFGKVPSSQLPLDAKVEKQTFVFHFTLKNLW